MLDLLLGAGEAAAGVPLLEGVDLVERGLDILQSEIYHVTLTIYLSISY